jgi:triosephosphate isomerase
MRTPIIAGNWKMNNTIEEAVRLVSRLKTELTSIIGVDKVICPPFTAIAALKELLWSNSIHLGAQNIHYEDKGAYTGEISATMVAELCDYVIVGHSERRQYFGDTDEVVNKKVYAALRLGLTPIICVGEQLNEREEGRSKEVVTRQLSAALTGVKYESEFVIAYEPVWAIGTGRAAHGTQANETIGIIRDQLANIYNAVIAQSTRILYGGSVTESNATEFISQPEIDGALVGGASLKAEQFISIVKKTAEMR